MNDLKCILLFFCSLFVFSCHSGKDNLQESSVPIIRLDPDNAGTLKMSDYFDGYRILTFKGIVCKWVNDFVEIGDKIVATPEIENFKSPLSVFDSTGNFLYQIGDFGRGPGEYIHVSPDIMVRSDSSLLVMDVLGVKNYGLSGCLLWEKKYSDVSYKSIGHPNVPLNDSIIIYRRSYDYRDKYSKDDALLYLTELETRKVLTSFFPADPCSKYITGDQIYIYNDSVYYYSDIAQGIYHLTKDSIYLQYKIDKGRYDALTLSEDFFKNHGASPNHLVVHSLRANEKYVLGVYLLKKVCYYFIYDKSSGLTYNFKDVEDDLLKINHLGKKGGIYPFSWKPGLRQSNEYMFFYLQPLKYVRLLDAVKNELSEAEWEAYQSIHPDLLKIYREIDENSNTVVMGYKFK